MEMLEMKLKHATVCNPAYILKLEETVKDHLSHDNMEDECYDDSYLTGSNIS